MQSEIASNRLVLKILTMDDAKAVFDSLNYQQTVDNISFLTWPMTIEQAENWCNKAVEGFRNQSEFIYLAYNNKDVVGCIGLHKKPKSNQAEIGYWVNQNFQRQGIASEMLGALLNECRSLKDIKSLYATTDIKNEASGKLLEKIGFSKTGTIDVHCPNDIIRPSLKYMLEL